MSDTTINPTSLIGYRVVSPDGPFGSVDAATESIVPTQLVVTTGRWIFAKQYLVRTDAIRSVNDETQTVSVNATIPELQEQPYDPDYRSAQTTAGPFASASADHATPAGVSLPKV